MRGVGQHGKRQGTMARGKNALQQLKDKERNSTNPKAKSDAGSQRNEKNKEKNDLKSGTTTNRTSKTRGKPDASLPKNEVESKPSSSSQHQKELANPSLQEEMRPAVRTRRSSSALQEYVCLTPVRRCRKQSTPTKDSRNEQKSSGNTKEITDAGKSLRRRSEAEGELSHSKKEKDITPQSIGVNVGERSGLRELRSRESSSVQPLVPENSSHISLRNSTRIQGLQKASKKSTDSKQKISREIVVNNNIKEAGKVSDKKAEYDTEKLSKGCNESESKNNETNVKKTHIVEQQDKIESSLVESVLTGEMSLNEARPNEQKEKDTSVDSQQEEKDKSTDTQQETELKVTDQENDKEKDGILVKELKEIAESDKINKAKSLVQEPSKRAERNLRVVKNLDTIIQECKQKAMEIGASLEIEKSVKVDSQVASADKLDVENTKTKLEAEVENEDESAPKSKALTKLRRRGRPSKSYEEPNPIIQISSKDDTDENAIVSEDLPVFSEIEPSSLNRSDEINLESENKNVDSTCKEELKIDVSELDCSIKDNIKLEEISENNKSSSEGTVKEISNELDDRSTSEELQRMIPGNEKSDDHTISAESQESGKREEALAETKQESKEMKIEDLNNVSSNSDSGDRVLKTRSKDGQNRTSVSSNSSRSGRIRRPGISFTIGARLEARDFQDKWYAAKIIEVDTEEHEILIHFERWSSRFDEWVPMDSSRLRAITRTSGRKEKREKVFSVFQSNPSVSSAPGGKAKKPLPETRSRESSRENKGVKRPMPDEISDFSQRSGKMLKTEANSSRLSMRQKKNVRSTKAETRSSSYGFAMKRKKLLVGGIFQAKRPRLDVQTTSKKFRQIKQSNPVNKTKAKAEDKKRRGRPSSSSTETLPEKSLPSNQKTEPLPSSSDINLTPLSSPGSLSISEDNSIVRSKRSSGGVAPKEFIIEEDHNHFKCPIEGCNKAFRKDSLLSSHLKHYHAEPRDGSSSRKRNESEDSRADSINVKPTVLESASEDDQAAKLKPPDLHEKENNVEELSLNSKTTEEQPSENMEDKLPEVAIKGEIPPTDTEASASKETEESVTKNTELPLSKGKELSVSKDIKTPVPTRTITRRRIFRSYRYLTDSEIVNFPGQRNEVQKNVVNTRKKDDQIKDSKPPVHDSEEAKSRSSIRSKSSSVKRKRAPVIKKTEITTDELNQKDDVKPKKQQKQTDEKEKPERDIKIEETAPEPTEKPSVAATRAQKRRRINSSSNASSKRGTSAESGAATNEESWRPESYRDSDDDDGGREEVVNCICRYREEDGLMIQCENCMAWQHGSCFNIEEENKVPEKYICFACRSPPAQRDSFRFWYDQDWWKLGEMSCFSFLPKLEQKQPVPSSMIQCHTLLGNMYAMTRVLHSLRYKLYIAKNADEEELKQWYRPWPTFISGSHSCRLLSNCNKIKEEGSKKGEYAFFDHSYSAVNRSMGFDSKDVPPDLKSSIPESALENKDTLFLNDISCTELQNLNSCEDIARFSEITVKTEISSDEKEVDSDLQTLNDCELTVELGLPKDSFVIKKENEEEDISEVNNFIDEQNSEKDDDEENIDKIRPVIDALLNLIASQDIITNSVTSKDDNLKLEESLQQADSPQEHHKDETEMEDTTLTVDSFKTEIENHISLPETEETEIEEAANTEEILTPTKKILPLDSPNKVQTLDPLECQLNLLDHVNYLHEELDRRLDEISQQIEVLEAELDNSTLETSTDALADLPAIKKMLKVLFSDLNKVHRMAFFQ